MGCKGKAMEFDFVLLCLYAYGKLFSKLKKFVISQFLRPVVNKVFRGKCMYIV